MTSADLNGNGLYEDFFIVLNQERLVFSFCGDSKYHLVIKPAGVNGLGFHPRLTKTPTKKFWMLFLASLPLMKEEFIVLSSRWP